MVATPRPQHLILPVAPLAAAAVGLFTALLFAAVPTDLLEGMVVDSGLAAIVAAAEPPLGLTARLALALLCGGGIALVSWFGLFLLFGARTIVLQRGRGGGDAPVLRRADAHPDAPARRPLFANTDLGTPFLDVRAKAKHVDAAVIEHLPPVATVAKVAPPPPERPLPADLDRPLAEFDPAAVPDEPLDWFPPPATLAPRKQIFEEGERFETFALTPMVRPAPAPEPAPPKPSDSIHALLDRLESVAARRVSQPPVARETIEDTLTTLRRMATAGR